jgi:diguanylate cyclase (GGDEF)-like protein
VHSRRASRPAGAGAFLGLAGGLLLAGGLGALALAPSLATPLLALSAATALGSAVAGRRRSVALRRAAYTDRLTGLYRYEYFAEALPRELERARRQGTELSLVLLDLDRFKDFNDRHGHAAGNTLLSGVGRILLRQTRGADLAARFGGEELVVLVQGGPRAAGALAERVRSAVAELEVAVPGGAAGTTISAGLASFPHEADATRLLEAADEALYAAKRAGRDRVVIAAHTAAAARAA